MIGVNPKDLKDQMTKTLNQIENSDHVLADAITQLLYLVGEGDRKFETLFSLVKEIKDKQEEQAKNTEKLSVELHSIKTVITGNEEMGQKGFAKRLEEVETVKVDVEKLKSEFRTWGIIGGITLTLTMGIISNWDKIFK